MTKLPHKDKSNVQLYTVAVSLEGSAGGTTIAASCLLAENLEQAEQIARARVEAESPERDGFHVYGLHIELVPTDLLLQDNRVHATPKHTPQEKPDPAYHRE